jgi:hypothetical protein
MRKASLFMTLRARSFTIIRGAADQRCSTQPGELIRNPGVVVGHLID